MSRENVETLRQLADAFNRRDTEAALALLDPEVEFHSALVEKKTYRGYAGMRQYREDLDAVWSEWRVDDARFLPAGADQVLQLYRIVGRGSASGVAVEQDIAILWTLRTGRVTEGTVFLDQTDALEAVGLRE
jgi:ketosteroid isomerase-like protein